MPVEYRTPVVCAILVAGFVLLCLSRRRGTHLGVLLACFVGIGFVYGLGVIDDAYISLRYARNFANGDGFVFNLGERVEGYTCFLWVLLLGTAKRLFSAVDLVQLARYLGIGFGALTLLALYRFASYLSGKSHDHRPAVAQSIPFSLLLVSGHFPLIFWSNSGMETAFYAFLLVASTCFFSRHLLEEDAPLVSLLYASTLLVFACMTRPETYLIPICAIAFVIARNRRCRLRAITIFLLPFVVIFLPYFIWRYAYFGHLFPNTYYAKVGGGSLDLSLHGLVYLKDGAVPHAIILAFVIAKIIRKRHGLTLAEKYILSVTAIWLVTIVYTGADHFSELRFFVYLLPFMYVFAFDYIGAFADHVTGRALRRFGVRPGTAAGRVPILIVALATFLALFYYNSLGITSTVRFGKHLADRWGLLGRWLEAHTEPGDVVATPVVGAVGYYCDRTVVDMLGIVDPVIARDTKTRPGKGPKDHNRFNSEYVLSRNPSYIFLLSFAPSEAKFLEKGSWVPAIDDLRNHFPHPDYDYLTVTIGPHPFALYRRKDAR